MKTYVLTVSRYFPKTHKRAGEPTLFPEKIKASLEGTFILNFGKIHTIRANYDLWKKRIDEVNKGKAVLSLRYWEGKPYNSKQVEFLQLKQGECGIQEIFFLNGEIFNPIIDGDDINITIEISPNDGLSLDDFKDWFKGYNLSNTMAIIHFTNFRY